MAARSFKPKASSNVIEGAVPVDEQTTVTLVEEEKAPEATPTPVAQENLVASAPEAPETENKVPETSFVAVTFEDKSPKAPIERNVKIRLRVNHSCTIGGVRYHFTKGKLTNVPESVKAILLQADLLMPL